jgi:hypothetical protein
MKQYKWLSNSITNKVFISIILAVMISVGWGTSLILAATAPEMEWEKTFGGSGTDFAYSVQQTSDGGYIVAGRTNSSGTGLYDAYLIKTDASGNAMWTQTFGGATSDEGYHVKQTTDGGYIIAGRTESYGAGGQDAYLVKTDTSGILSWNQIANAVQQTTDGGYIFVGITESYGAGDQDVYLVKTDDSGTESWNQTFGGTGWEEAYHVEQTTDGGYIISGTTDSYGVGYEDVYLIKTDDSGNLEWETTFGGIEDEYAYSVEQTTDGGYILAGETYSYGAGSYDFYLIKTDALGILSWNQTFGGTGYEAAYYVQQTADSGYIIAGSTESYGAGGQDVYLVKTDASGNLEWETTFGGSDDDFAYSGQETTDGSYIMAGGTYSYGAGGADVYLVKAGSLVNTPAGSNVTVSLDDGTVNFPTVNQSGTTNMTTSTENPVEPTPSDFYVMEGTFTEITTTANYSGPITVGLRYDESQVANEESLRLFHWNGSEWEDITTSVDTTNDIVYGVVSSLSLFFLGEPAVLPIADAGGPYLVQVGYSVSLNGTASYDPDGTVVSYDWSLGYNTTDSGALVTHTYTAVDVYGVNLTVTDDRGAQSSASTLVVVYDPDTGSATGGGWFWSAQGNLKSDPESEGKATFGFVVKYKHDTANGNLGFHYRVGDINLKDSDISWLVVSSPNIQFQGEGTINGEGLYTFRVLAKDGDKTGGQPDEFTIKIWQGTDTEADPIYQAIHAELGGGNIIVHTK